MSSPRDVLMEVLMVDYENCRQSIDKFDEYRARLKSWMITTTAGLVAVSFSSKEYIILWFGLAIVPLFALSEFYYLDIQEDVIERSAYLEPLIDSLRRAGPGPEHEAYKFGIRDVFGGGRRLKISKVARWALYRTFNPFLYGGLLLVILVMAILATI